MPYSTNTGHAQLEVIEYEKLAINPTIYQGATYSCPSNLSPPLQ